MFSTEYMYVACSNELSICCWSFVSVWELTVLHRTVPYRTVLQSIYSILMWGEFISVCLCFWLCVSACFNSNQIKFESIQFKFESISIKSIQFKLNQYAWNQFELFALSVCIGFVVFACIYFWALVPLRLYRFTVVTHCRWVSVADRETDRQRERERER